MEYKKNDTEFDLLRQVAVNLKSQGHSIESFAPLVRIREILRRELLLPDKTPTGITIAGGQEHDDDLKKTQQLREEAELEKKLESLLLALVVFCFKQKLPIKDFADLVCELRRAANRLDLSLENLPGYFKHLENILQNLKEEIQEKRLEKQEALEDYDVTLELLEEYKANRPSFEENKKLREELDKVRKERDDYEIQLAKEKSDRDLEDYYTWTMSEAELEEANDMLDLYGYAGKRKIDVDELKEIALDVYHRPTKYIDAIRQYLKARPELSNQYLEKS